MYNHIFSNSIFCCKSKKIEILFCRRVRGTTIKTYLKSSNNQTYNSQQLNNLLKSCN